MFEWMVVVGGSGGWWWIEGLTYQSHKYKERHEYTPQSCLRIDVAIADSGHGYQSKVYTFPIRQFLRIGKVIEWVT